ncbi:MAG TPA: methyltransferase domain-containing protein [Xanthomonadales bacterium]|nr:methyltransferase domain-containing protein [Xanthomonadales bacterium]
MIRIFVLIAFLIPAIAVADRYDDVVASPSRPEADLARDGLREPATVLRTIGIDEGLIVLDMGGGGGYYAELFSYLVGDSGEVIIQNPSQLYEIFPNLKDSVTNQRLADDRLANTRLIDSEAINLDLPDASVDLVMFHLIYHDMYWLYPDQVDAVNAEIQRVLRPGGRLVIIDHDSVEGAGNSQALSRGDGLHRIEDAYVEESLTTIGFELTESSDSLRNPDDDKTQPFFSERMSGKPTDRFFQIYTKPM